MRRLPPFLALFLLAVMLIPEVPATALFDSYTSASDDTGTNLTANAQGAGQCFNATFTGNVVAAQLKAQKSGTPTGTGKMRIWSGIGAYGTACIGMNVPLAESEPFDISTLTGSTSTIALIFSGNNRVLLTLNRTYALTFDLVTCTNCSGSNYVIIRADNTSPGHAGNSVYHSEDAPPNWTASSGLDRYFSVEGAAIGTLPSTTQSCGPTTDSASCGIIGLTNYLGGGVFGGLLTYMAVFGGLSFGLLWITRTHDDSGKFTGFALPAEALVVVGVILMFMFASLGVLPTWMPVVVMVVVAWLFAEAVWGRRGGGQL